jgi:hypothetical protein
MFRHRIPPLAPFLLDNLTLPFVDFRLEKAELH